jgi:putative DNA primase/helicase
MRSHRDPLPHDLQERADIAGLYAGRNGKPDPAATPTTPSTPIFEELPTAPDFPVDALPLATRRLVREAAAAIGCPPEMIAVPLLGTLSAGIGASRMVQLKRGWREGATLFLAVVARPGTKKTPAAKAATAPAWERQAELRRRYTDECEVYEAECRQWKDGSSEESEDEEPAPGPPDEPKLGRTVVEDTTTEALFPILAENPRGVLVGKDELTGWLRSMNQYKGGKGSDRQVWLSLWSNSPTTIDRKGRAEPIIVPRPFVSLVGSVQPEVLPVLARGPDDGLWDRFLISYPELRRARISDAEISDEASANYTNLYDKLTRLEMGKDENREPVPKVVPLSGDAWEVFKELSGGLQDEMHAPGFPAHLEGVWSKMEAYLARLALILAMCRVAEQGGEEQVEAREAAEQGDEERVEARDVVMASGLVNYFKAHARRVHVDLHGQNTEDLLAKDLAEFLEEHDGEWKDEPSVLHEELKKRKSEALPERPDELSKMVLSISERGTWLKAERGWGKKGGESCRMLHLRFRNGVVGVVGVV